MRMVIILNMPDILAKLTMPLTSGLPGDAVSQTFAFATVRDADVDQLAVSLPFWLYNTAGTDMLVPLAQTISGEVSRLANACDIDLYDITGKLDGSPTGSPVVSSTWTLGAKSVAGSMNDLPSEVAFCVTLEGMNRADFPVEVPDGADAGSAVDRPRQRHTGRTYIGPLTLGSVAVVNGVVRPSSYIRDTARLAVRSMADHMYADTGGILSVWSRKNAALYAVQYVASDDAFDTMRSRGVSPTVRTRIAAFTQ